MTITLTSAAITDVTVDYTTVDDTAIAGSDYQAVAPTTLTIQAGNTSATIRVNIIDDSDRESDETFNLNLSNASSNATIADNQGVVTITDNDSVVDLSFFDDSLTRFQNSAVPGTYLFVGDAEAQNVRDNFSPPFTEEGFAFNISSQDGDGLTQFNRFQSTANPGTYLFANETESISIRSNFADAFTEEGIAFYAFGADANIGQDVIRFRNINTNTYLFSLIPEAQSIRANFADTFVEEGIAFEVAT